MIELKIGETVIYGIEGICRVEDKREEDFGAGRREYYVLRTVNEAAGTTLYIPADNEILLGKVRKILSPEEIHELIDSTSGDTMAWTDDNKERTAKFRAILESGDRRDQIRLIRTIYDRKHELSDNGKRMYMTDENALKRAEKMLYDEFSLVLDMKIDDMPPLIFGKEEDAAG